MVSLLLLLVLSQDCLIQFLHFEERMVSLLLLQSSKDYLLTLLHLRKDYAILCLSSEAELNFVASYVASRLEYPPQTR